jgi:hypothetical protein
VNKTMRLRAIIATCATAIALAPGVANANDEGLTNEAGVGALAAVSTLVYGPVKIAYATMGLLFGGMAWGLSGGDQEVLEAVITPSVRGDYVVTPQHIRMQDEIEFFGRDPAYRYSSSSQTAMVDDDPMLVEDDY